MTRETEDSKGVLGEETPVILPPMRGSTSAGEPGGLALLSGTASMAWREHSRPVAQGSSNKLKFYEKVNSSEMPTYDS